MNLFAFTSGIYTKDTAADTKSFTDTTYLRQVTFPHIPAYDVYFNTLGFQQAVQNVIGLPYIQCPFFTQGAILVPGRKN